jgi:hypothetical protein
MAHNSFEEERAARLARNNKALASIGATAAAQQLAGDANWPAPARTIKDTVVCTRQERVRTRQATGNLPRHTVQRSRGGGRRLQLGRRSQRALQQQRWQHGHQRLFR